MALLLDPLAPPPRARDVWERIDALAPQRVVLKPDHVRDVDLFVRWYGCRALRPLLFWPDDVPATELEAVHPGGELPGGLLAFHDGATMRRRPSTCPSSGRWSSPTA